MDTRRNEIKAMMQDLAGYRLTILVVLFLFKEPMQNSEVCEWTQLTGKTAAKHLDWLEAHRFAKRTILGWILPNGVQQLDFLKELAAFAPDDSNDLVFVHMENSVDFASRPYNHLNEKSDSLRSKTEILRVTENFSSTGPTTTTKLIKPVDKNVDDSPDEKESENLRLNADDLKALKREIVWRCLGENESYNRFIEDAAIMPEFILGHYLQLLQAGEHENKAKLVDCLLNRAVHPGFYKRARKMIIDGDY